MFMLRLLTLVAMLCAGSLSAATITVTDLNDDTLANLAGDGQISLREAIEAANSDTSIDGSTAGSGADVIVFATGLSGTLTTDIPDLITSFGPTVFVIDSDFTITITPTAAGSFSLDMAISSDDADENPYNVHIVGAAPAGGGNGKVDDKGGCSTGADSSWLWLVPTFTLSVVLLRRRAPRA